MDFLKNSHTQYLQKSVETHPYIQSFLNNRHKNINRDGNPDLCFHRVFCSAIKGFYPQMLFDPSEEQLYLPAAFIELSNSIGG